MTIVGGRHSWSTTSVVPNRVRSASSQGQPFPLTFTICLPITWTLLTASHRSHLASRLWRSPLPDMGSSRKKNHGTVSDLTTYSPAILQVVSGVLRRD